MKYEMRYPPSTTAKRAWDDPCCHPTKTMLESMYASGQVLFVENKAQSLKAALKIIAKRIAPPEMYTEEREDKNESKVHRPR